MPLFTPAWKRKNEEAALRKINSITDQKLLLQIALDPFVSDSRAIAAIQRIHDENILFTVATQPERSSLMYDRAKAAVGRISNKEMLMKLALGDKIVAAEAAASKITDDDLLIRYVEHCIEKRHYIDRKTLDRIKDTHARQKLILKCPNDSIRKRAVSDFAEDDSFLVEVALSDKNEEIRLAAAKEITGEIALAQVAENTRDDNIRKRIINRLKDEEVLSRLAVAGNTDAFERMRQLKINNETVSAALRNKLLDSALSGDTDAVRRMKNLDMMDDESQEAIREKLLDNALNGNEDAALCLKESNLMDEAARDALRKKLLGDALNGSTDSVHSLIKLNLLNKAAQEALLPQYSEDDILRIVYEEDENRLYQKLKSHEHGEEIWKAYKEDSCYLMRKYPCPQTVEAAVLLLTEKGTRFERDIINMLKDFYKRYPNLQGAISSKLDGYQTRHYDNDSCAYHDDHQPEIISFM